MRYTTLLTAAFLGLTGLGAALAAAPLPPAVDRQLARDMFKTLVEINTTHAHGSTAAALAIQEWLLKAGFAPADVTFVAPEDHPTKGNVVLRYRGRQPGNAVLFMGHLDVVEAKAEDWSVDPFLLTEKDGWFYGRGTIDMKDGDAALVESLIRLKRERFVPTHDLLVAFTADEEAGGDANGPAFLLKSHRDLIDAALAINLDGGGGNLKNGRPLLLRGGHQREDVCHLHARDHESGRPRLAARTGQRDLPPGRRPRPAAGVRFSRHRDRDHACQLRAAQRDRSGRDQRRHEGRRPEPTRSRCSAALEPEREGSTPCCGPPASRPSSRADTRKTRCHSGQRPPSSAG